MKKDDKKILSQFQKDRPSNVHFPGLTTTEGFAGVFSS